MHHKIIRLLLTLTLISSFAQAQTAEIEPQVQSEKSERGQDPVESSPSYLTNAQFQLLGCSIGVGLCVLSCLTKTSSLSVAGVLTLLYTGIKSDSPKMKPSERIQAGKVSKSSRNQSARRS